MKDIKMYPNESPIIGSENRLLSLDALRGFDMFWITGGGWLITTLSKLSGMGWIDPLAKQMSHVPWEGFHFYDLIFPLFMFVAGIAVPLSVRSKLIRKASKKELVIKVGKRMIILILLGAAFQRSVQRWICKRQVHQCPGPDWNCLFLCIYHCNLFQIHQNNTTLVDRHSDRDCNSAAFCTSPRNWRGYINSRRMHQRIHRQAILTWKTGLWSRRKDDLRQWNI